MAFIFFTLAFTKFAIFDNFLKNQVVSFLLLSGLCHINGTSRSLYFWQCYKHLSEGTLNQNPLVYGKLKWEKSPLFDRGGGGVTSDFYQIFHS